MKKFYQLRLRANKYHNGFTLVELLIVLALIAILASLSGVHAQFLNQMIVRAELEHLYALSYSLQRKALMFHEPQKIICDVVNNTYSANGKLYRLPAHVRFGTAPGVKGPPSSPDVLIQQPITFKDNTIVLYPDGIIRAGALYLTDHNRRCTYALSCSVSAVSYLRKYQYTNGWRAIS